MTHTHTHRHAHTYACIQLIDSQGASKHAAQLDREHACVQLRVCVCVCVCTCCSVIMIPQSLVVAAVRYPLSNDIKAVRSNELSAAVPLLCVPPLAGVAGCCGLASDGSRAESTHMAPSTSIVSSFCTAKICLRRPVRDTHKHTYTRTHMCRAWPPSNRRARTGARRVRRREWTRVSRRQNTRTTKAGQNTLCPACSPLDAMD